ncbi:hypothetical Protein pso3_03840 [Candidatus Phytoplasma solani]
MSYKNKKISQFWLYKSLFLRNSFSLNYKKRINEIKRLYQLGSFF